MQVTISSRNAVVSPRLEDVTREKIGRLDRFFEGLDHAEVHFSEEKNPRISDKEVCEVTLQGHGHHVRCKVSAPDGFSAIDKAVDKLEHQLHKLKTKVVNRNHKGSKGGSARQAGVPAGLPEAVDTGPRIVKQKRFSIQPITPDEAVMQMDLVGHDFYFFTNSETDRAAVVYRRFDGDIGLIDEAD